jgi:KTSC domain
MDRVAVVSSVIEEVGYNASSRTLEILFKSGAIYLYYFVPQDVHDALMAADSKGNFFNKQIKKTYEYHRIAEPYDDPGKARKKPRKPGAGKRAPRKRLELRPGEIGPSPRLRLP